ncbi:DHA2 family efflux MFS transporter permease subunit [Leuconostoc falkenbergense]|uniref:DHA2 family efflux MFS transporter permease subunit n=1 Tax=Leuconostoc falkenbergense TaxID=2766470 RepID=A0A9X3E5R1_9LACO|nr:MULTISPECIES: DHA2 family efflux MFS transporter permease subunit [Leuconostoc]RDG18173.1 MFS transporter [Leuconostoc pseudomesenteroides]MCT4411514.1 DHA2 family efflux MFS transporter permease subunit [Leuconostoc falkenbergense]MCX7577844.1 DHA2 family efflux MFS transporter permease subunit [Leuconostoc falkenbergense]MDM7646478.1 DHA2 family efflux MFS transporter permease subunit [Leuconostoc falkenbergense]MDV3545799.1 DHA2 family efflux MFS transporter permease subunit [Leuconostoc
MNISQKNRTILIILVIGTFLGFLNQTLMNVALPDIMREFHISTALGQWLTNGYMLVNGIMVPLTAFLIQRLTTRALYLTAVGLFAIGTITAGFAPNFEILITGRMIQAMGAGVFGPLMNVVVMNLFAPDRRGSAMGTIGLALNFAPALGPSLSGFIVTNLNWRFLFYIVAPLIIANFILAYFLLNNIGTPKRLKFDMLGVILSSIGLGSLLYGFSNAGGTPWHDFTVWGFVVIGLVVTTLFILHQLHTSTPLLNMSVFSHREFNVAVLINIVLMMAMYGGALMLPLYMQNVRGASAFISGLVLFPGALVTAFLSPWSGRLYDRYGAKYLTLTGILITAVGTFILASLTLTTPLWFAVIGQFVRQLGLVLVLMPIQTEAFNALPLNIIPDGSAMFTTIRQLAASFGTAALVTIMTKSATNYQLHHQQASSLLVNLHGVHITFLTAALLMLVAAAMTGLLKPKPIITKK